MDQRRSGSSRNLILGLVAVAAVAGGAAAWISFQPEPTTPPDVVVQSPPVVTPDNPTPSPVAQEQQVQIYWLESTETGVEVVPSTITLQGVDQTPEALLTAGMTRLLAGPANTDVTSTIPTGTKLNSLQVRADGIYVDLSRDFTTGGGSTSMQGRVAQVLYTATSLDPQQSVWLSIDGEPLTVLGGEGLVLDQPLTRQNFDENFTL